MLVCVFVRVNEELKGGRDGVLGLLDIPGGLKHPVTVFPFLRFEPQFDFGELKHCKPCEFAVFRLTTDELLFKSVEREYCAWVFEFIIVLDGLKHCNVGNCTVSSFELIERQLEFEDCKYWGFTLSLFTFCLVELLIESKWGNCVSGEALLAYCILVGLLDKLTGGAFSVPFTRFEHQFSSEEFKYCKPGGFVLFKLFTTVLLFKFDEWECVCIVMLKSTWFVSSGSSDDLKHPVAVFPFLRFGPQFDIGEHKHCKPGEFAVFRFTSDELLFKSVERDCCNKVLTFVRTVVLVCIGDNCAFPIVRVAFGEFKQRISV